MAMGFDCPLCPAPSQRYTEHRSGRQTSGGTLDLGVEAGRVGGSHCAPGAVLMGQVAPRGTKLLIPRAPECVSPDLVCALHSNVRDKGKGHEQEVTARGYIKSLS